MYAKPIAEFLKILISLNCIGLFFVPLNHFFGPVDGTGTDMGSAFDWQPEYFYSDEFFMPLVVSFLLLWIGYLVNKNRSIKIILTFLLLALSGVNSFLSFLSINMMMQDLSPHWGMVLLMLFFPLLIFFFLIESKVPLQTLIETEEDMLLDEDNW